MYIRNVKENYNYIIIVHLHLIINKKIYHNLSFSPRANYYRYQNLEASMLISDYATAAEISLNL